MYMRKYIKPYVIVINLLQSLKLLDPLNKP